MLDPALCVRPTSQWISLKEILSTWLITPSLAVPTLASLVRLPWVIPKLRWKRQLSGLSAIVLLIYFIATLPPAFALAYQGLVGFLPVDSGATVDAIVVLGRGEEFTGSRVEVTAELWQANRASLIFASGRGDAPQIIQMLRARGIPQRVLEDENCSQTTEENARFTAAILQPQASQRILLVTDPPHMLRSLLTFRSLGFVVVPHLSQLPPNLAFGRKALIVYYEYLGLVSYSFKGRFFPRRSPELNTPSLKTLGEESASSI